MRALLKIDLNSFSVAGCVPWVLPQCAWCVEGWVYPGNSSLLGASTPFQSIHEGDWVMCVCVCVRACVCSVCLCV